MIKNDRLNAIVDELKDINILLDIGTDHGLVIKKALSQKIIKAAIAADISPNALNQARANLVNENVEYYVTDGFKGIKETFDGVVIAGMGAETIINILKHAPNKKEMKFVLQANGKYDILRTYLANNNYKIINETIVYDKFYYIIISAIKGDGKLSFEEIYLGPILMNKKTSIPFYEHLLKKEINLLNKVEENNKQPIYQKIKWLKDKIR